MISIATPQPGELYYLVDVGVYLGDIKLTLAIPTRSLPEEKTINFDHLIQGAKADKLKNKSVDHLKVDGTLSVVPESLVFHEAKSREHLCEWIYHEHCSGSHYAALDPVCWISTKETGNLVKNEVFCIPVTDPDLASKPASYNHTFGFASKGSCSFGSLNPNGYPVTITWNYDFEKSKLTVDISISVKVLMSDMQMYDYGYPDAYFKHAVEEHREYDLSILGDSLSKYVKYAFERKGGCSKGNCVEFHYRDTWVSAVYPSTSGSATAYVRVIQYTGEAVLLPEHPLNLYAIQTELAEAELLLNPLGKSPVWSELMLEAMHDSTYLDNNMLMFVKDIVSMKDDFQNLRDAGVTLGNDLTAGFSKASLKSDIRKWERKHGRKLAKDVCNVYLPLIYGYKLTFDEAVEIGEKLAEKSGHWGDIFKPYQARKSRHIFGSSKAGNSLTVKASYLANLQCKDNSFSEMYAVLQHTGLQIGLNDAWDWIPYSFCVNWVVDVSNFLDSIDCYGWQCNYDLISCVKSNLTTLDYIVDERLLCGQLQSALGQTLSVESYKRWVEFSFDPPPFFTDFDVKQTIENLWYHRTEGAALILQRLF